jgi:hypothetical protein
VVVSSFDLYLRANFHDTHGLGCEGSESNVVVVAKTRIPEHAGN